MTAIENEVIYKFDLLTFLRKLRKEARHIYRVLAGAPIDYVWISKSDAMSENEVLSVDEFLTQYARFKGRRDEFRLCFRCYYLRHELHILDPNWRSRDTPISREEIFSVDYKEELTINLIAEGFPHLIAYLCREALLVNTPVLLMNESVKKQYGFVRTDIDKLRDSVNYYNQGIVEELRAEYNRLESIDWVRNFQGDGSITVL